jgi:hypothetical protein
MTTAITTTAAATATTAAAATARGLTMRDVRAALPTFFEGSAEDALTGYTGKGSATALPLARQCVAAMVSIAVCGDSTLRKGNEPLKTLGTGASAKGTKAQRCATARDWITAQCVKAQSYKSVPIDVLSDQADAWLITLLECFEPEARAPRTTATCAQTLKALREAVIACASMDDLTELKATLNA